MRGPVVRGPGSPGNPLRECPPPSAPPLFRCGGHPTLPAREASRRAGRISNGRQSTALCLHRGTARKSCASQPTAPSPPIKHPKGLVTMACSAQRHKGGGRRPGDSRGAEYAVGAGPDQAHGSRLPVPSPRLHATNSIARSRPAAPATGTFDLQTAIRKPKPPYSSPSSTSSAARSTARALASVSFHSSSGTESATTPAAACTYRVWPWIRPVRIEMATSMSPA